MPSQSEKKRANGVADDQRPKKRIAIDHNDKPISVNVLKEDVGSWPAVFTKAPGLELTTGVSFKAYHEPSPPDQDGKRSSDIGRVILHSTDHPRLDYIATQPPPESFDSGYKHYVGIYDPAKSSFELLPARQLTVKSSLKRAFIVEQQLAEKEAKKAAKAEPDKSAGAKYAAARRALGEEFGTKRAKAALKSAAFNAIAAPTAGSTGAVTITSHTQAILEGANMGDEEDDEGDREERKAALTELSHSAHPRPTPNISAERPADVYKLTRVVGRRELDMINVDDWIAAAGEHQKVESQYVAKRLIDVVAGGDLQHIKALKYLNILVRWKDSLAGGKFKKVPKFAELEESLPDVSRDMLQMLSKKFAPNSGKLNAWDMQRLMLYMCAIALVLERCTTDVYPMQEDLRITSFDVRNLYKELGCKVTVLTEKEVAERGLSKEEARSHYLARLRVPFKLKEVRTRAVRR